MRDVANLENQVDWLRDRILSFLHRVAAEDLTLEDGEGFINTVKAVQSLDRAADIIESDLTKTINENRTLIAQFPDALIRKAEAQVLRCYREIGKIKAGATMESCTEGLPETDEGKPVETAPVRGARLKSSAAEGVKQYRLEYELMEALKRIRRHLHRARVQLETSENSYADMDEDRTPEAA